jgi:uncharacterized protein YidB (DUF937 family)
MGLLDSVLGAALNSGLGGSQQQGGGGLGGLLGGLLGGQQGGSGGVGGLGALGGAGGLAALIPVVAGMLGNDGAHGGLGGLMDKFKQAGMGDQMSSWVGSGENLPISADQLSSVLGSGAIGDIAAKLGMSEGAAGGLLSQALPEIINHMTPGGQAPEGGLGGMGDLASMLGKMLQK